ncbi:GtrA family protein [Streptomyces sp. NPDC004658]|uniref:GtrA family protein n=1 Tax=Streptomyces sp. NPDC004658 TaxID=3154672 RepID=UPI00339EE1E5
MTALPADVSVVVPASAEAGTLPALLTRIAAAVPDGVRVEVVFTGDSPDHTGEAIEKEAAVVEGLGRATAPWIVVVDAGLRHPPELIFELVARGESAGAELVVAGRHAAGGGYRTLVSGSSALLAKSLFPRALSGLSDPMSGFFAIRRTAVDRAAAEDEGLPPLSHRTLLELAVRCRPRGIAEVPRAVGERHAGTSGSPAKQGMRFLRRLIVLRTADPRARAVVFGLVGLSGFVPNLALLWLLTVAGPGLPYAVAEIVANQAGLLWNFALIDSVVYRDQRRPHRRAVRLLTFAAVGNADLVARIPLAALLIAGAGMTPLPATALSMAIVFTARFLVVDRWLYRRLRVRTPAPAAVPAGPVAAEPVPDPVPDPLG